MASPAQTDENAGFVDEAADPRAELQQPERV
jgi:hypothetical protein